MGGRRASVEWRFMFRGALVAGLLTLVGTVLAGAITGSMVYSFLFGFYMVLCVSLVLWSIDRVVRNRVIKPLHMLTDKAVKLKELPPSLTLDFKGNDELAVLERTLVGYYNEVQTVEWARLKEAYAHAQTAEVAKQGVMQMLDSLPFSCQVLTLQGQILDCNNSCVEFFGYKSKDDYVSSFNILTFSPAYQTDGACSVDKWRQLFTHVLVTGICEFEWTYYIDGELVPVGVTLTRVLRASDVVIVSSSVDLRRTKKLEEEAHNGKYDFLTGIYNRRAFDIEAGVLLASLKETGGKLAVLYMDIDFFKRYNDTYGHNEGDRCLKLVADRLRALGEELDILVARFGGEEFVVAFTVQDEARAIYVANLICTEVRALGIKHETNDAAPYVTLSIGVTVGSVSEGSVMRPFIETADAALYESKQGGRNRSTYIAKNE